MFNLYSIICDIKFTIFITTFNIYFIIVSVSYIQYNFLFHRIYFLIFFCWFAGFAFGCIDCVNVLAFENVFFNKVIVVRNQGSNYAGVAELKMFGYILYVNFCVDNFFD